MFKLFFLTIILFLAIDVSAHHVLGRPAYSLNEDSNTPPSMQIEIQMGDFYITYMVYPAFPKPNERGRVNLYASRIDNGNTFIGEITFKVRDDLSMIEHWFKELNEEVLGVQTIYDGVYRQGFLFKKKGDYIITAQFEYHNIPYVIDFPLQIGETSSMAPIGITLGIVIFTLLGVNIFQRRHLIQAKMRTHREDTKKQQSIEEKSANDVLENNVSTNNVSTNNVSANNVSANNVSANDVSTNNVSPNKAVETS